MWLQENHYRPEGEDTCYPCECFSVGSESRTCDPVTGQCPCKGGVIGRQCNRCDSQFAEVTPAGCQGIYISFKYLLLKVEFLQLFSHQWESKISHLCHVTILKNAFIKSLEEGDHFFLKQANQISSLLVQHEVSYWYRGRFCYNYTLIVGPVSPKRMLIGPGILCLAKNNLDGSFSGQISNNSNLKSEASSCLGELGIHDKDSKDHFTSWVHYSFTCSGSQSESWRTAQVSKRDKWCRSHPPGLRSR